MAAVITDQQSKDDVRWQISPGWEHLLLGPAGLRLPEWLRDGSAQVVKDGSHRTVYRVDLPDRTLYLKHYRCRRWTSIARHWLRASASRREWRQTVELARRRIPTAVPIAWGEQQRFGLVLDNYFVTEGIAGTQSLDQYVRETLPKLTLPEQTRWRRGILTALGRLAAQLHGAGVFHNDFHTGNILIALPENDCRVADAASPRLYLIDLPSVRLSGPLTWPRSRDGLAMLAAGWLGRLSKSDRRRFWNAYLAGRPELRLDNASEAAEQVERRTREFASRVLRGRDKRALRTNRHFYRLQTSRGRGHAVREFPPERLAELITDPQKVISRFRHQPVKLSHSSLLVEAEIPLSDDTCRVAYKRSRTKSWWKRLLGRLRPGRAMQGWRLGHALLERGVATARPLAAFEPRGGMLHGDSFLVTTWIEGAENLHLYLWRLAGLDAHQRHRRACQVAESLGRLLGRMHAWQISHGDLKACNLVVAEQAERVDAWLIDLDGVRICRRLSDQQRAADLARLAVSMEAHAWLTDTQRWRFLKAYVGELGRSQKNGKEIWRQIARRSGSLAASMRRRGQPVV